jgi:dTDP-4-amino-4,6-dideoxygalactose transaminase
MPVKIPSMTVPLVANTIIHAGEQIHFVDEHNWVGRSYELAPYNIIDSAHEVSRGQFLRHNDETLLCFSFYPTKPITSCEGGMICTNDLKAVEWLRKARFYGRNSDSSICKNSWEYDIEFPGWKMNMTEIQAAICLEQLHKLPKIDKKRQDVVDFYNEKFNLANMSLYLYRLNVVNRDGFVKYMSANGVECGVHFRPLHLMKPFANCEKDDLSQTEIVGQMTVSLPLYDTLFIGDMHKIVELTENWRRGNV